MVDLKLLRERIDDSGMTMTAIANKSGILRETMYNRLNGVGDFTASEIVALVDTLKLKKTDRDNIFFAKKVEQYSTEKGETKE